MELGEEADEDYYRSSDSVNSDSGNSDIYDPGRDDSDLSDSDDPDLGADQGARDAHK